ncbi:MAG: phosphatase PAP2 family protein [Acidimicrobiales bacterium]
MTSIDLTGASPDSPEATRSPRELARRLLGEMNALDCAIYDTIAHTPTPALDVPMTWIANAANYSRFSIAIATALAVTGKRGRRAAIRGLAAVGVSSFSADLAAKHFFARSRPDRRPDVAGRQARMPASSSFPSGHTASAFAFATAVTADFPQLSLPLFGLATIVGYSRIHVGVHYPADVVGGELLGLAVGSGLQPALHRLGRRKGHWPLSSVS